MTAGDALKRVPGVTFLSDVIESDGARLRGLDPGYTQILINGERVPGGQADRSFFLDRIPAELIEQVEIVRSSSARRTGDAVA
ncbi:MAG: TonB-dependent receptor plug domain-containing protein, partial [Sphingomonadales bacterium]